MEIISYDNKETQNFDIHGKIPKKCKWGSVSNIACRKLDILHNAYEIKDFKVPPGNHFKWLPGDLKGYASIRINDQWRIIFLINKKKQLESVEITDYH